MLIFSNHCHITYSRPFSAISLSLFFIASFRFHFTNNKVTFIQSKENASMRLRSNPIYDPLIRCQKALTRFYFRKMPFNLNIKKNIYGIKENKANDCIGQNTSQESQTKEWKNKNKIRWTIKGVFQFSAESYTTMIDNDQNSKLNLSQFLQRLMTKEHYQIELTPSIEWDRQCLRLFFGPIFFLYKVKYNENRC